MRKGKKKRRDREKMVEGGGLETKRGERGKDEGKGKGGAVKKKMEEGERAEKGRERESKEE